MTNAIALNHVSQYLLQSAAGQMNNGSRVTIHKKKLRLSDPNESEVVDEPAKVHPIPKYVSK